MKGIGFKERKMGLDTIFSLMEMFIKANLRMGTVKGKAVTLGLIRVTIKDNGLLIK